MDWVKSMIGPAVTEVTSPSAPTTEKPHLVLYADDLMPSYLTAAKENRRKAVWFFVRQPGSKKVVLSHGLEEDEELSGPDCDDKDKIAGFLSDHLLPLFGVLNADTWDRYMEAQRGLIWSLFPDEEGGISAVQAKHRPMMATVARRLKPRYFVTYTDTGAFK